VARRNRGGPGTPSEVRQFIPARYDSRYPGSGSGDVPLAADQVDLRDPLIWPYAAALTGGIKPATGVSVLPLRNTLVAASQVATLDALSGGRVILGVGVGRLAEEFAALERSSALR